MFNRSFIDDYEKMVDFVQLDRVDFLNSYSYLTESEYDSTLKDFVQDMLGTLVALFRKAEQLMLGGTERDITSDKEVIVQASKYFLSEEEYKEFETLII